MPETIPTGHMVVMAVETHKVPKIDLEGRTYMGLHVGYDRQDAIIPEGVLVPKDAYHLRCVERGALVLLADAGQPFPAATTVAEE